MNWELGIKVCDCRDDRRYDFNISNEYAAAALHNSQFPIPHSQLKQSEVAY